jgi:ribonuclease HII
MAHAGRERLAHFFADARSTSGYVFAVILFVRQPMPHYQLEASYPGLTRICGVDEAGRGPWAGPVVAASVMFTDTDTIPAGLNDSKKLSATARDALFDAIHARAVVGVGIASVVEIDQLNIWGATALAMRRAVLAMNISPELALIDGNLTPPHLLCEARTVVKGDSISLSIAAASIIAKVTRDRLMHALATTYPAYGFERHAGYGTPQHINALETHGPCPAHRTSFAPIRALLARAHQGAA